MKNKKRVIQVIAIVLALLLAGGVIFGALMSAFAEELPRDRYEITMEYLQDEQALRITQRLIYTNRLEKPLRSVVFYAAGNMFRRESALMYENDDLEKVFFAGYAPAGIDLQAVRFNGEPTDFGFRGENELYLRVDCGLQPGESSLFEFEYYLLLMTCGAFQGVGPTGVGLSAFLFVPGICDGRDGEFNLKQPLPYTRWLYCDAADYSCEVTLPRGWALAASAEAELISREDETCRWRVEGTNLRDFALSFGRRYREYAQTTDSGVKVRALCVERGAGRRMVEMARKAIGQCEEWFGPFPVRTLTIAQSDYPLTGLNFPGLIWASNDLVAEGLREPLEKWLRFCVAQQYFGLAAYTEPSADAWLSDSVCEYIACLMLEDAEGRDAFLKAINREWVSALQMTIPGGLTVTSDAALFDASSYEVVVRIRGAVVMHELRLAMGLEDFLDGLAGFYEMGKAGNTLTEKDLVSAMDRASGRSWEDFLTDWVFNVDEYVNQTIVWYE